jgi:hypothetical protein
MAISLIVRAPTPGIVGRPDVECGVNLISPFASPGQISTADHGTERVRGSFGLNVFYAADSLLPCFLDAVGAFGQGILRVMIGFRHARSLLKNSNNPFSGEADALTSLRLHHRSQRIGFPSPPRLSIPSIDVRFANSGCSVGAPSHRIRRTRKLNCRIFSTDSQRSIHFYCRWGVAGVI